ncbi:unnamed protein product [Symbiodinium sp. CCMP2592]|nr:unnamed protein product [Symbiodinium sp. CCMP2592]
MERRDFVVLVDFCVRLVHDFDLPSASATRLQRLWGHCRLYPLSQETLSWRLQDELETLSFIKRLLSDITLAKASDFVDYRSLPILTLAETLVLLDLQRQLEQLWHTGTPYPGGPNAEMVLQTLYPGRQHPGLYTPPEQVLLAATTFQWVFQTMLMGVPATLSPQVFCNFMLWTTFPVAMMNMKMQTLLSGGSLHFSGADSFWSEGHWNWSWSPRSALLLFSFGLSIQLRSGIRHPNVGALCTVGFRPTLRYFQYLTNAFQVWNRRYLDYFLAVPRDSQLLLNFANDDQRCMLQSTVILCHPGRDGYFLCDQLNNMFNREDSPWWRLYHLPIQRRLWNAATQSQTWDQVPREMWQVAARPRL